MNTLRKLSPLIFIWAFSGCCGGGDSPVGVGGVVTLDGEPVPDGRIVFSPVSRDAGQLRDSAIADGSFDLPTDEGLLPGLEYEVSIKGFRKTGRKYRNADMGASYDEFEQYIPAQYNANSTLRVLVSHAEEDNQLTFELTSKPTPN